MTDAEKNQTLHVAWDCMKRCRSPEVWLFLSTDWRRALHCTAESVGEDLLVGAHWHDEVTIPPFYHQN